MVHYEKLTAENLEKELGPWRLPLLYGSATDYAFLVNNNLGYISDDARWYSFNSEESMRQFQDYLTEHTRPIRNTELKKISDFIRDKTKNLTDPQKIALIKHLCYSIEKGQYHADTSSTKPSKASKD